MQVVFLEGGCVCLFLPITGRCRLRFCAGRTSSNMFSGYQLYREFFYFVCYVIEVGCDVGSSGGMPSGENYVVAFGYMSMYEVKCAWVDLSYTPVCSLEYVVLVD